MYLDLRLELLRLTTDGSDTEVNGLGRVGEEPSWGKGCGPGRSWGARRGSNGEGGLKGGLQRGPESRTDRGVVRADADRPRPRPGRWPSCGSRGGALLAARRGCGGLYPVMHVHIKSCRAVYRIGLRIISASEPSFAQYFPKFCITNSNQTITVFLLIFFFKYLMTTCLNL